MRRPLGTASAVLVAGGLVAGAVLLALGLRGAPAGAPPRPPAAAGVVVRSAGVAVAWPAPGPAGTAHGAPHCGPGPSLAPPLDVTIARLDVHAPVVERVTVIPSGPERGLLSAPADYHDLGWYSDCGVGVLLVDGHVGFAAGAGPLAYIGELSKGDVIAVRYAGGARSYKVVSVVALRKGSLPASYFTRRYDGDLMLITCDYRSTFRDGHFADNVYVLAVPTGR